MYVKVLYSRKSIVQPFEKELECICLEYSLFLATNTFFCKKEPNNMTKNPANAKRMPANIKILGTPSILNSLYPHLMNGAALPHSVQHSMASKNTCNGFLKNSLFSMSN